jgi:hypothetical protein
MMVFGVGFKAELEVLKLRIQLSEDFEPMGCWSLA